MGGGKDILDALDALRKGFVRLEESGGEGAPIDEESPAITVRQRPDYGLIVAPDADDANAANAALNQIRQWIDETWRLLPKDEHPSAYAGAGKAIAAVAEVLDRQSLLVTDLDARKYVELRSLVNDEAPRRLFDLGDWLKRLQELRAKATGAGVAAGSDAAAGSHVFKREGGMWRLVYEGQQAYVKHTVGMLYLAELLRRNAGEEVRADKLRADAAGRPQGPKASPGVKTLDEKAVEEFKAELAELEEELDEAKANADLAGQERIQKDITELAGQLSSSTGVGGHVRKIGDDVERARVAVTQAVDRALKNIHNAHKPLWEHLDKRVSRGRYFRYTPDGSSSWLV